jgi:cytoskeletal protein RodZ
MEWFKFVFEVSGGSKHPVMSLVIIVILFGAVGGVIWRAGSMQYQKDQPVTNQTTPPTINQSSDNSNCSNLTASAGSSINCSSAGKENNDTPHASKNP